MDALPLMEAFYTIQGEGFHQGKAAVFIRLAGCDVGCHWCDVKESWDSKGYPVVPVTDLVRQISHFESDIAVVTGGEPLMYDLGPLSRALKLSGFSHETRGMDQNIRKIVSVKYDIISNGISKNDSLLCDEADTLSQCT